MEAELVLGDRLFVVAEVQVQDLAMRMYGECFGG